MEAMPENLLAPLTALTWWPEAYHRYSSALASTKFQKPLVLYNADVDGFAASYFVYKFIYSVRGASQEFHIQSRPVWNYEYDFKWVPAYLRNSKADLVICVDIPIIQELETLAAAAEYCSIVIYDHHVVHARRLPLHPNVLFLNSRELGGDAADHPASAFAAAAANRRNCVSPADLVVLATGLRGDWALAKYPNVIVHMEKHFPELSTHPEDWKAPLGALTSNLNAMFRAHPGAEFKGVQDQLLNLLRAPENNDIPSVIESTFDLYKSAQVVQLETTEALEQLNRSASSKTAQGILLDVLNTKTFNVGVVATILAKRGVAPIVALGFRAGERVQFELRVAQDSSIDLTRILTLQKKSFQPITSGGHPKAAGALVWMADVHRFSDSLRNAFKQLTNQEGACELHPDENT